MQNIQALSLLAGTAWTSGINLYLTVGLLGIADRMDYINLPGNMETLANPLVIGVALLLYLVEFVADKIPVVDSAWDSFHTFIRPAGSAFLGLMATHNFGSQIQYPVALLTGTVALDSHLTKATARAAINTSPEPVTNSVASVTEDVSVVGIMYLVVKHPIISLVVVILLVLISIWFLKKMFKFLKKVFSRREEQSV